MRRPVIAANWKMHKTVGEAVAFAEAIAPRLRAVDDVDVVIAPPYPALQALGKALEGSGVALAAQNVHPQPQGAFTGEVSTGMLVDLGCRYVILGHSERRAIFGETSAFVAEKLGAVLDAGLRPIVCVGESLEEREAGRTFDVVGNQLDGSLEPLPADRADEVVVAYEPVWAIGTGKTATPDLAQEVHAFVRKRLAERLAGAADRIRIQYGGSVKPDNAADLMARPDIDGALVGGASLDPESFCAIIGFDRPPQE
jgi:triosephosphate isomerase